MTPEERAVFLKQETQPKPVDGKGVYLEPGTEDEFEEYHRNEEMGWKAFINKIKNL